MIFIFSPQKMNNHEQNKEYKISFYTFFLKEEDKKELKKIDEKRKNNGFVIAFCSDTISVILYITLMTFAI